MLCAAPCAHDDAARQHTHTHYGLDQPQHIGSEAAQDHWDEQHSRPVEQEVDHRVIKKQTEQSFAFCQVIPTELHVLPDIIILMFWRTFRLRNTDDDQCAHCKEESNEVDQDDAIETNKNEQSTRDHRGQHGRDRLSHLRQAVGTTKLFLWHDHRNGCCVSRLLECAQDGAKQRDNIDVPQLQVPCSEHDKDEQGQQSIERIGSDHDDAAIETVCNGTSYGQQKHAWNGSK